MPRTTKSNSGRARGREAVLGVSSQGLCAVGWFSGDTEPAGGPGVETHRLWLCRQPRPADSPACPPLSLPVPQREVVVAGRVPTAPGEGQGWGEAVLPATPPAWEGSSQAGVRELSALPQPLRPLASSWSPPSVLPSCQPGSGPGARPPRPVLCTGSADTLYVRRAPRSEREQRFLCTPAESVSTRGLRFPGFRLRLSIILNFFFCTGNRTVCLFLMSTSHHYRELGEGGRWRDWGAESGLPLSSGGVRPAPLGLSGRET